MTKREALYVIPALLLIVTYLFPWGKAANGGEQGVMTWLLLQMWQFRQQ